MKNRILTTIWVLCLGIIVVSLVFGPSYLIGQTSDGGAGVDNPTYVYSLNVNDEFIISGPDGNDGDVLTTDGAGNVILEAPTGGGGNDFAEFVNITGTTPPYLNLKETTPDDTDGGGKTQIFFRRTRSGGEENIAATWTTQHSGSGDDEKSNTTFQPTEDSTDFFQILDTDGGTPILNIDAVDERVGIGTATPSEALGVDGNIELAGNDDVLKVNGTQVLYLPDQTDFFGTYILGNSGGSLSHASGTEGHENLFIGTYAGQDLSSGRYNVFVGVNSGANIQTGEYNVAVGRSALYGASGSASNNMAIGASSMYDATSNADSNVAIGTLALRYIQNDHNLGVGYWAGYALQNALHNVLIGTQSGMGSGAVTKTASYNVIAGYQSGYKIDTADNNVFLGYQSGYNDVSGDGSIFLGYQSGYNETTGSRLYIENSNSATPLIYGEFDNDLVKIYGTLQGDRSVIADADGIILTAAQMGSYIFMTGAGEVLLPDTCDSATGSWVRIINKTNTNQVEVAVSDTSNDKFVLLDGTVLGVDDEADLATGPNNWGEFTCMETNTWYVLSENGVVTDGGVAD